MPRLLLRAVSCGKAGPLLRLLRVAAFCLAFIVLFAGPSTFGQQAAYLVTGHDDSSLKMCYDLSSSKLLASIYAPYHGTWVAIGPNFTARLRGLCVLRIRG